MKVNPKKISWTHDGKNTDGTTFDPSQFQAFILYVNDVEHFAVPLAWQTDGEYEFPIKDASLPAGRVVLGMTVRTQVEGQTLESDKAVSEPFIIASVPTRPLALSVA